MKQIGFLFDISGSMQSIYVQMQNNMDQSKSQSAKQGQTRFNTVINILQKLAEEESLKKYQFFSLGFDNFQKEQELENRKLLQNEDTKRNVDCHKIIYEWAKQNGAPNLNYYFKLQDFRDNISKENAFVLYKIYQQRRKVLEDFVKMLPAAVKQRSISSMTQNGAIKIAQMLTGFQQITNRIRENVQELNRTINKHKDLVTFYKKVVKPIQFEEELKKRLDINKNNIKTMKVIELKEYFKNYENLQNISMNIFEKIAYGGTSLCRTLKITSNFLLSQRGQSNMKNILFLISDSESSDGSISPYMVIYSKRLIWNNGAKQMFQVSSELDNSDLTFVARNTNFKLSTKGKSRLFMQANDPKTLNEFFEFIVKVKDQTDVLLDLIGKFDIEQYVCSSNEFEPKNQNRGICYANSISAVYCMATRRIFERNGGHLNFEKVRENLINKYGSDGAKTAIVLQETCKDYRLRYKNVNITEAKHVLNAGRPLVAIFRLFDQQWKQFSSFYKNNPKDILENVGQNSQIKIGGHSVVLIGYTENYLKFMNSWGTGWADSGFFKIKDEQVLGKMEFFDFFWTEQDLLENEKLKYQLNSAMIINQRAQKYKDIYENIKYTCPMCNSQQFLSDYQGNIYEAICQKCNQQFKPQKLGETFISYIYGKDI
ncbi:hypothetical protein ABPG72_012637 [Tetrahymena utriculariae]